MGFFDPATKQVVGAGGSGGKVRSSSPSLDLLLIIYPDILSSSVHTLPLVTDPPLPGLYCSCDGVLTLVSVCAFDIQVFKNTLSDECLNVKKSERMWELSCEVTGAKWPKLTIAA